MAVLAAGMAEMAKDEASRSVVDLKRAQAISDLANSSAEVAANLQRLEASRAELERLGDELLVTYSEAYEDTPDVETWQELIKDVAEKVVRLIEEWEKTPAKS
jgi:hypothetical protein